MKKQYNEIKRMQQLAGIRLEAFVDAQGNLQDFRYDIDNTMEKGDYVTVKGDSHVYQIIDFQNSQVIVEDGHKKQYIVDQSRLRKYKI